MFDNERSANKLTKEIDFVRMVDNVFRSYNNKFDLRRRAIITQVANMPAPRFYISAHQCMIMYNQYKRLGYIPIKKNLNLTMYADIFKRYEDALHQLGETAFKLSIMESVLNSTAPSFYMTEKSALKFYYSAIKDIRLAKK